jgi:hypothetical protein
MSQASSTQTPRWLLLLLTLIAIAALTLLAACGGDDDEENGGEGDEPTATESTEDGDDTPEATDEEEEDGGDGDAASDLSALSEEYSNFRGFVKYETTGFADDSFSTMTIYRGDGVSRVDYEGTESSGSFITNDDGSFACADNQCVKFPAGQAIDPTAAFTAFINPDAIQEAYGSVPDGVTVEESSVEIAGLDATCYDYSGDLDETESGDESGQVCFSESGILLRLDFTGTEGGGRFEAVEAEEGVTDADFEPPFPVVDLDELGQ